MLSNAFLKSTSTIPV